MKVFMVLHVSLCNCFQEASGIAFCRPVSGLSLMNCDSALYELHSQCYPIAARQVGTVAEGGCGLSYLSSHLSVVPKQSNPVEILGESQFKTSCWPLLVM